MFNTLKMYGESNHSIRTCSPVQYCKKDLLIDPYLLGIWLGDGSRGGQIETADPEIFNGIEHKVIKSTVNRYNTGSFSKTGLSKSKSYMVHGLITNLTKIGLLRNPGKTKRESGDIGFYHKHIPEEYMHSSIEQRLALLQGLMDSDGCCAEDGKCEFVQVESRKELAYQVLELLHSLGIKASIIKRESYRYEKRYQDKYRIQFYTTLPVFRLQRKLINIKNKLTKSQNRFIKNIEPIQSKPMRCITVDSPSHLYLITRSFIVTHNTMDAAFYDEVQDISSTAIGAVNKTLAQAHYGYVSQGVQVYFGTPKQKGTHYYNIWNMAHQHYFHLRCRKCDELFPLYRPDVNWEDIWLYGFTVKCTKCGEEQDKRKAAENGKWVPIKGTEDGSKYIGYHINQLYMPTFTKENILDNKPERNPNNTERLYQNEVLGEFYDGEGALLSTEQIYEVCGDAGRTFTKGISPHDKKRVYAGFDWGQKGDLDQLRGHQRGQSYSCGVILTAETPHRFIVEYGLKLKKNDPQYKLEAVEELYRRYSILLGVGDIGDAHDLTHVLQRKYGDRFLASRAAPKVNGHIRYNKEIFPKEIIFERDYVYSELFGLLKAGAIRFPMGSYESVAWMAEHCCSMDIKVGISRQGDPVRKFIKGPTPNDFFCALVNAWLAYKFHITQGFNIKQPQFMKYDVAQQKRQIPAIVGYLPKWK